MDLPHVLWVTFWAALVTDLATGLGVLPFLWLRRPAALLSGGLTAMAAGMMIAASVLQLIPEAWALGAPWQVFGGFLSGVLLVAWLMRWVGAHEDFDIAGLRKQSGVAGLMVVLVMTLHSLPEGVAIGVAYGEAAVSQSTQFGWSIALVLAIHNIPEGVAITAALRGQGLPLRSCFFWAIVSSLPQPLGAVPSAAAVWFFQPLLPGGLAFAAGAMLYLVGAELIPESRKKLSSKGLLGGVSLGAAVMALIAWGLQGVGG